MANLSGLPRITVEFSSDSSIQIRVQGGEDETSSIVLQLYEAILKSEKFHSYRSVIENYHPAYESLLIDFDPLKSDPKSLRAALISLVDELEPQMESRKRIVEIPVVYGGEEGPDLPEIAKLTGLSTAEVIRLHSEAIYRVCFLGFTPGFPYMNGLPSKLFCPRKASPRLKVPAGSVAIAGAQAGIYPSDSPGGWQILGRTEVVLFDPNSSTPSLLLPGDRVRFAVSRIN